MKYQELKMWLIFKALEAAPILLACAITACLVIAAVMGLADVACIEPQTIAVK